MKKRDIKKLKDAFDIPEPERKAEFTRIHGEKFAKKKTAVSENPIFRYAPALALAAILIGLWGFIKPDGSLRENPGKNNVVVESTDEIPAIVTTSAAQQTSSASSVVQTDKKPITTSAVPQGESHIPEDNTQPVRTERTPQEEQESPETTETASVPHTSADRTSSAVTETTARKTTSAASSVTTAGRTNNTTTSMGNEVSVTTVPPSNPDDDVNNQQPSTDGKEDMTIIPDIVYTKTDNIYCIEYDDMPNDSTTDSMDVCDMRINGYVMDIIYTKAKNMPYTQLNVVVTDIKADRGQLSVGCMISVYIPGGYMPSDEYFAIFPNRKPYQGDYTVYDCAGISKPPEIGDIYSFYLNRDGEGIPDGAFVLASERPASMKKIA